jgi:hypothetical protein
MTPIEYLRIETEQRAIIQAAQAVIDAARRKADRAKPPKTQLRPARAADIRAGLIVWHDRPADCGGWYWHVVEEPLHYGDEFKAYCADDGCRYGLDGAWVYASEGGQ